VSLNLSGSLWDTPVNKAPTIVARLTLPWFENLVSRAGRHCRRLYDAAPFEDGEGNELKKLAPDVWAIDKPLGFHTDSTERGHYVFGMCLINEADCKLVADNLIHDFPPGTIYTLNGHRRHGVLGYRNYDPGKLLGFLAWDVPNGTPLKELVEDLPGSINAWLNGKKRVNILQS
jgi:hypothetical protein